MEENADTLKLQHRSLVTEMQTTRDDIKSCKPGKRLTELSETFNSQFDSLGAIEDKLANLGVLESVAPYQDYA